ncbi:hypothetical protein HPB52_012688 [Rhipicephalus sanguineus]|uniref:Uncharacterized protein n=1 Tax=Rhipicephalus sanguineus TaxID=34632 RepID=A0A9D4T657_RHISA|nr:hypothetical protein HPB52_012688 [Rhipicephalus sanguineus]
MKSCAIREGLNAADPQVDSRDECAGDELFKSLGTPVARLQEKRESGIVLPHSEGLCALSLTDWNACLPATLFSLLSVPYETTGPVLVPTFGSKYASFGFRIMDLVLEGNQGYATTYLVETAAFSFS